MENKHFITIWWIKIYNIQFSSNSEVKGSWLEHYIKKVSQSGTWKKGVCRNSSPCSPVEKGHRERSCCVCEGGLRRKHDVGAERVSVWGERTKERNREGEKKGVSSLRWWDKIRFYVCCKIQHIQLSSIRPHWTKSQRYNSKVNHLSLNTRLGILFIDPSCMK